MAGPNTPRRGYYGSAWVTWIVVLVIIGVGIWLIFAWTAGPPVQERPAAAPAPPSAAPVTSLSELNRMGVDWEAWVGRQVELTSVPVLEAYPGIGIFIGTDERSYFVRSQTLPKVARGQHVSITGVIERVPADPARTWNLPPAAVYTLNGQTIYVQASSVRIVPAA